MRREDPRMPSEVEIDSKGVVNNKPAARSMALALVAQIPHGTRSAQGGGADDQSIAAWPGFAQYLPL